MGRRSIELHRYVSFADRKINLARMLAQLYLYNIYMW